MYVASLFKDIPLLVARRLAALRTLLLIPLVIGLGVVMGLAFTSPAGTSLSSLLNLTTCAIVTFVDPPAGFLLWLFLNPLVPSLHLSIDLGAGIPDLSLDRLTVALILVILLAEAALGKRELPRLTRLEKWMILTVLALGISVLGGVNLVGDIQIFLDHQLIPFLVYFVARNMISNRRHLDRFLVTIVALGAYCGIYGIYNQLTGNVLFTTREAVSTQYTAHLSQMQGLLGSPYAFGLVFSLTIPINFYKLIAEKEAWKRLVYALTLAAMMLALFLTYKRGAWLGAIASFVVIQRFYPQFRYLFFAILIVVALVMGLTWDRVSESDVVTERATYGLETGNGRTNRWEEGIRLWKLKPIFGHGWGGFSRVSRRYSAVESTYLWILVSAGLAGMVPFIMMLVSVLREAIDLVRLGSPWSFVDRELVAVFGGLFVGYMVNIVPVYMNSPAALELTWALVGAIIGSQSDGLIDARATRQARETVKVSTPA